MTRVHWLPVKNEKNVEWPLKVPWNSLRLRTVSQGNVKGPETSVLMFLEVGPARTDVDNRSN